MEILRECTSGEWIRLGLRPAMSAKELILDITRQLSGADGPSGA